MADASYQARSDTKHAATCDAPLATQSSNAVNRPALALTHTYAVANRICHMASPCAIALVLSAQPITDTRHTRHRHSSPTLVTLVTHVTDTRHRLSSHSSHSSPSPTPSPILAGALVVINLLTNTLSTILHQSPAPPLRQPPTAVVSRRQHQQQQQQQPTTLCRCRTGFGSIGRPASPACQPAW